MLGKLEAFSALFFFKSRFFFKSTGMQTLSHNYVIFVIDNSIKIEAVNRFQLGLNESKCYRWFLITTFLRNMNA